MLAKILRLADGEYWEAISDDEKFTLTRKNGGYEQYREVSDTEAELLESMQEIAPLDQWQEWED